MAKVDVVFKRGLDSKGARAIRAMKEIECE